MNSKQFLTGAAMRLCFGFAAPFVYSLKKHSPVDEQKAVFVEYRRDALPDSLELICRELSERGLDCRIHCLRQGFVPIFKYLKNCIDLVFDLANAKYIVVCEGGKVFSRIRLRKETAVLQTWHACGAFKRFGFSAAKAQCGADINELLYYMPYNADICSVSSPDVIWAYREAFGCENGCKTQIFADGVSRTDVYFMPDQIAKAKQKLHSLVPEASAAKTILYAPTFRGEVSEATAPELPDLELLKKELGGEYIFIIKQHPVVKNRPKIPESCKDFAFDLSEKLSPNEALMSADVLVTDYSSVVFEYSLLSRPMVFFIPDQESYADERGFYYPLEKFCPGEQAKSSAELAQALKLCNSAPLDKVQRFRHEFMRSCDGNSTKRIVERLLSEGGKRR